MTIEKITNGTELTVKLAGRLDTTTAPELEVALKDSYAGVEKLVLDFAELEYLSSAGLRVLLGAQKTMNKQGEMVVKNVNDTIDEIFEAVNYYVETKEEWREWKDFSTLMNQIPDFVEGAKERDK
jgi:anti-sigma B factor antagonist